MNPEFLNLAISKFYSRIVLKKLSRIALTHYRKVENLYKKVLKLSADIRYLDNMMAKYTPWSEIKAFYKYVKLRV